MSFIGKYFDIPLGLGRAMYQCVFFYMGIFIFHLPINWIAISGLKNIGMNRMFLAIFMIIFSYGISWLITVLLRRTPIKKLL